MSASKSLLKVLTTPCKLASAMDWKKMSGSTILSLDIHSDRIGLTRCDHPSSGTMMNNGLKQQQSSSSSSVSSPCYPLETLPLDRKSKTLNEDAKKKLADIVKEHNVCGFVVSWPMQPDTGRMGASCGRTLYTLEQLLKDKTTNTVFSQNRPLCFWDANHVQPTKLDAFGRSPEFARTTNKTVHLASQEQYHQDEKMSASQVWQDFCEQYWPKEQLQTVTTATTATAQRRSLVGGRNATSVSNDSWQADRRKAVQVAAA
ncbi:hypothetical protein IV203_034502 [Nitzschia inconspicua]|uniref:Uncharacterized protein n=1 Tax=Nitzschia inconspicua TaxID=303405 RepID=A0A9K3PA87_9STRA|nr:hypothetical protein IV203_002701 [Nitzschia inconspicua]KAG7339505.1 hypothetical protein IV203_002558 [Nitzschia inconspicua]KAG7359404.1 hypothetical protein IV203_034502 [Nitzschia inconspicua]